MFVQATTPRPVFDSAKYPEYIYVHTLSKEGVSDGAVCFTFTSNPEFGKRESVSVYPHKEFPIEGEDRFFAREYVVPFWNHFPPEDRNRNLRYVTQFTAGFDIFIKSAFRVDTRTYQERALGFRVVSAVTGGGVVRLHRVSQTRTVWERLTEEEEPEFLDFDIANSAFDPWAAQPSKIYDEDMALVYNRTHKLGGRSSDINARRAARIAEAEANMRANASLPLEGGTHRSPPRPAVDSEQDDAKT